MPSNMRGVHPDIPVINETIPGYEVVTWNGVVAPAGMPAHIVQRLDSAIGKALADTEYRERARREWAEVVSLSSAEFAKYLREIAIGGKNSLMLME